MISVTEIVLWKTIAAKRYAISQKRSGSVLWSRLWKYRYTMPAHTVPLRALSSIPKK